MVNVSYADVTAKSRDVVVGGGQAAVDASPLRRHADSISSSSKQNLWQQEGARLRRAALQSRERESVLVQPLKKTLSDMLLACCTPQHGVSASLPGLHRPVRNALSPSDITLNSSSAVTVTPASSLFSTAGLDAVSATPVPLPIRLPQHLEDSYGQFQLRHAHVIAMLSEDAYLPSDSDAPVQPLPLLKAAVSMLIQHERAARRLAKNIMLDMDYFGGERRELTLASYRAKLVRDWIAELVFDADIEDFLADQLAVREADGDFTTAALAELLRAHVYRRLGAMQAETVQSEPDSLIKDWIWQQVVLPELPLLAAPSAAPLWSMSLTDMEWGQMHAASLLVQQLGGKPAEVAAEQLLELGQLLLVTLEQAAVPASWGIFFRLPARVHEALTTSSRSQLQDDAGAALAACLQRYFDQWDDALTQRSPVSRFQRLLEAFKTRPQLAQELLERDCPQVALETLLNFGEITCWSEERDASLKLKNRYQQQVDELAAAFTELDKLVLMLALTELEADAIAFIQGARIQRLQASLSAAHQFRPVVSRFGTVLAPEALTVRMKDNVDVLSVSRDGQERIYALEKNAWEYVIQRIDRERAAYCRLAGREDLCADAEYKLRIHGDGQPWPDAGDGMQTLSVHLVRQHGNDFSKALYAFGHHTTVLEKTGQILLSLIPGYTCITESRQGNEGAAILACSQDVLTMFPLLGRLSAMSVWIGQSFYGGGLMAIRKASREMAARSSLAAMLRSSAREFALHGMLPARALVNGSQLRSLGIAVARSLDPGVELLGRASMAAAQRLGTMAKQLHIYFPELQETFRKIKNVKPVPAAAEDMMESATTGYLPGLEKQIPVMQIQQRSIKGKPLYVQFDPETGALFGHKYSRDAQGILRSVHMRVAERIQRLREQGLSGRGGIQAAQAYAGSSRAHLVQLPSGSGVPGEMFLLDVSRVALLKQLGTLGVRRISEMGGLQGVADHYHVAQEWLAQYLRHDGQLTRKAEDLITGYHLATWIGLPDEQRQIISRNEFVRRNSGSIESWKRLVSSDGVLLASGFDLLARLEWGTTLPLPNAGQLQQWMALPELERYRIGMTRFALDLKVSPGAFERLIKKNLSLAQKAMHQRAPGAQSREALSIRLPAAADTGLLRRPGMPPVPDGTPDMPGGTANVRRHGVLHTNPFAFEMTYEHLKVWSDLSTTERNCWHLADFVRVNQLSNRVYRSYTRASGAFNTRGLNFQKQTLGMPISQEESRKLSLPLLQRISQEGQEKGVTVLAVTGGLRLLALQYGIHPALLARYLNEDASLNQHARLWMQLAAIERNNRPSNQIRSRAPERSMFVSLTYEYVKIWHDMSAEQRAHWHGGKFVRACTLSEEVWSRYIGSHGELRPDGIKMQEVVLRLNPHAYTGVVMTAQQLLELQPHIADGIAAAGGLGEFAEARGVNENLLRRYYSEDGSLTSHGKTLRELFEISQLTPAQYWIREMQISSMENVRAVTPAELPVTVSGVGAGAASSSAVMVPDASHLPAKRPMLGGASTSRESVKLQRRLSAPPDINRAAALSPRVLSPVVTVLPAASAVADAAVPPMPSVTPALAVTTVTRLPEAVPAKNGPQVSQPRPAEAVEGSRLRALLMPEHSRISAESGKREVLSLLPADPAQLRQYALIDNSLPSLQDPLNPRTSVLAQVEGPITSLEVWHWGDLQPVLDKMDVQERERVMIQITDQVHDWLHNDGHHAAELEDTMEVSMMQLEAGEAGMSVVSKRWIRPFQVMGSYAGGLFTDRASLWREMLARGEDNVNSFLWETLDAEINISAYGRGNVLSLIDAAPRQNPDIHDPNDLENLASIRAGKNLVFYVAKREIAPGEELLVSSGDRFGVAW